MLAVHEADMDCRVQAGVTRKQLNEHLKDTGWVHTGHAGASLPGPAAEGRACHDKNVWVAAALGEETLAGDSLLASQSSCAGGRGCRWQVDRS